MLLAVIVGADNELRLRDYRRRCRQPDRFKNNVLAVADLARYFELPTILTTSFEDGPNGPIVPELKETFPEAPFIPRPGQINAWDNEDFVAAVNRVALEGVAIKGMLMFENRLGIISVTALELGGERPVLR